MTLKALILVDEQELKSEMERVGNQDLLRFVSHPFYGKFRIIQVSISYDKLVRLKLKTSEQERLDAI